MVLVFQVRNGLNYLKAYSVVLILYSVILLYFTIGTSNQIEINIGLEK